MASVLEMVKCECRAGEVEGIWEGSFLVRNVGNEVGFGRVQEDVVRCFRYAAVQAFYGGYQAS